MPDRSHPPPNQRRVTDTDSDSKSSTTDGAHTTSHRKRLDSSHKKHPLGKHTSVKPRMGPRSSSSRQVAQLNKSEEQESRRHSADMDNISPKNMGSNNVFGKKEKEAKEQEGGASTMGSKGEWDDVVDLDGIKAKALEREASALSLQGLNLQQQRKLTGGMRRNRSAAEMAKRRLLLGQEKHTALKKSASHTSVNKAHTTGHGNAQGRASVHFDLGHQRNQRKEEDDDGDDDGWTEASGSASPNLSRNGSVAGQSSGQNSARGGASKNNSEAPSMSTSPERSRTESRDWSREPTASPSRRESYSQNGGMAAAAQASNRHPDATQITTRLLQRVASHSAAPQMSAISATALPSSTSSLTNGHHQKDNTGRSQPTSDAGHSSGTATPHDLPSELISRFKGSGPGTPGESPLPYHPHLGTPNHRSGGGGSEAKHGHTQFTQSSTQPPKSSFSNDRRAKSMSNLNAKPQEDSDSDDRPLAPRSRKSSTAAYAAPPQSRTQQKLWLQRASSNIESAQPSTSSLGLNLALSGLGVSSVLDADGLGGGDGNPLARTLVGSIGFREGEGGMGVRGGRGGDPRVRIVLERGGMAYRAVGRFVDPVVRSLRRLDYIPGSHRGATRIPHTKSKSAAASVRGTKETRESLGAGARGLSQSLKDARGGGFLERANGRKSMDQISNKSAGQPRSFDGRDGQGSLGSNRTEGGNEDDEVRMLLRGLWESNVERSPCKQRDGEEVDE